MSTIKRVNWMKIFGLLSLIFLGVGLGSGAKAGVDLPFYAAVSAKPNVLILLDTSGSMVWLSLIHI